MGDGKAQELSLNIRFVLTSLTFLIMGAVMMGVASRHLGGEIVGARCECFGERGSKGAGRTKSCKVDVHAVIPHSNATVGANITGEIHDAPRDCDFCDDDDGNGTFPCFVNTASDRVGYSKDGLSQDKSVFVMGAAFVAVGCGSGLLTVVFIVLTHDNGEDIQRGAYPSDYDYTGYGYGTGYANPAPTPDYGYAMQQQQNFQGAYGMQYGVQQASYGLPLGQGAAQGPYYGGYYNTPTAF